VFYLDVSLLKFYCYFHGVFVNKEKSVIVAQIKFCKCIKIQNNSLLKVFSNQKHYRSIRDKLHKFRNSTYYI